MIERIEKFIWRLRAMWTAADMVYESQRNVLDMTVELAREVEKRIKLKRGNEVLREKAQSVRCPSCATCFNVEWAWDIEAKSEQS